MRRILLATAIAVAGCSALGRQALKDPIVTLADVKVTGAGTIRIQRNPRKSAFPYIVRVRTHDGKYAKMHILSYYCANKSAGCLTFEYVYQGDGSPRLAAPSASGA